VSTSCCRSRLRQAEEQQRKLTRPPARAHLPPAAQVAGPIHGGGMAPLLHGQRWTLYQGGERHEKLLPLACHDAGFGSLDGRTRLTVRPQQREEGKGAAQPLPCHIYRIASQVARGPWQAYRQ
jgi:hypothetical protein